VNHIALKAWLLVCCLLVILSFYFVNYQEAVADRAPVALNKQLKSHEVYRKIKLLLVKGLE
jgi:hypothetical protein